MKSRPIKSVSLNIQKRFRFHSIEFQKNFIFRSFNIQKKFNEILPRIKTLVTLPTRFLIQTRNYYKRLT